LIGTRSPHRYNRSSNSVERTRLRLLRTEDLNPLDMRPPLEAPSVPTPRSEPGSRREAPRTAARRARRSIISAGTIEDPVAGDEAETAKGLDAEDVAIPAAVVEAVSAAEDTVEVAVAAGAEIAAVTATNTEENAASTAAASTVVATAMSIVAEIVTSIAVAVTVNIAETAAVIGETGLTGLGEVLDPVAAVVEDVEDEGADPGDPRPSNGSSPVFHPELTPHAHHT